MPVPRRVTAIALLIISRASSESTPAAEKAEAGKPEAESIKTAEGKGELVAVTLSVALGVCEQDGVALGVCEEDGVMLAVTEMLGVPEGDGEGGMGRATPPLHVYGAGQSMPAPEEEPWGQYLPGSA